MDESTLRGIVTEVLTRALTEGREKNIIPVEVSGRHVHLSKKDAEALFGAGCQLTPKRDLSQPGQYLCEERVTLLTSRGEFRNVAVLGPLRDHTQVELSLSDAQALGIDAPVRLSGDTKGTPGIYLLSEKGMVAAKESVIVAQNHIHMTPADALRLGVRDGQFVRVRKNTPRHVTFDHVPVRVSPKFSLAMHIDFDEANACGGRNGLTGTLIV